MKPDKRIIVSVVSCTLAAMGTVFGQQGAAPTFSSPADAAQDLIQAVQSNDTEAIERVLGGPTELASSHDDVQDKSDREMFIKKYKEMHRLHRETDGSVTLYIGAENWPFPVPLLGQAGAWHFDPAAGKSEVLVRRIGENELNAIVTCHDLVAAGRSSDEVIGGYHFRTLASAAATAIVAYPAEYRSSGVMTFVATSKGVIYEKDLGANTSAVAGTLTSFHKDATWRPVAENGPTSSITVSDR